MASSNPIPAIRRVSGKVDIPHDKLSSTPGGTLFSTTPGGTRIIYDREFLLNLRNSPLAKSPPNIAVIPGITKDCYLNNNNPIEDDGWKKVTNKSRKNQNHHPGFGTDDSQFEMDL